MLGLIFTYGLTIGGSVVSLVNPFMGLLIYISFSIISPSAMWPWAVPQSHFTRVVAIAMLIGWLFKGFGQWDFGRSRGVVLAISGFTIWAIFSALAAADFGTGINYVENHAKIFIPFLVGITVIDSLPKLKQLAWVMLLSLGYVAFEMNLSYYLGYNRAQLEGLAGMDNNSLAIAMVAGVGLAFFVGVGATKWWHRFISWTAALLMAHTVMFAFSRGGMLALIVSMVASFALLPPKKPRHIVALLICVAIGFRLAGPEVTDRFLSSFAEAEDRDVSAQSRLDMWEDLWDSTLHNPILGVGPDHWPLVAPQYGWPLGKEGHSLWLQTSAEMGIPGVLFLLFFYGLCMIKLWPIVHSRVKDLDPWYPNIGRMVIAGLVGFIIAAQFVSLEGLELPYYVALLGAGALKLLPQSEPSRVMARMPRFAAATSVFLRKG